MHLPREIDLLICGGGTSGAALAGIVARDTDQHVVVLEAGPDYGPLAEGRWPRDVLDASTICRSHQWGYSGIAHVSHTSWTGYDRAKILGGCSAHNGCVALLGHRRDYDRWAELGNTGWDWASVAPAFERAKRGLRVRLVEDDEITPWQQIFIDGCVEHGIPRSQDMNDPDENECVDASPVNIYQGIRWNTALGYIDPVRGRPNLTIIPDVLVDRVVIERGRAVAVEAIVDGRRERFGARRIVLSAGAYGSPAILLRSGIGPGEHLREVGIPAVHALDGVGRNLADHSDVVLRIDSVDRLGTRMDDFAGQRWLPDEQTLAKVRSRRCREAFDLHLFAVSSRSPATGQWSYKIDVACVEPWSTGYVRLASDRPQDAPLIDHGFVTDPDDHDLDVLIDGIEVTSEIMSTNAFTSVFGTGPESLSRDDLRAFVHNSVGIYYHPACSCRMGPSSDATAVVDPTGKLHGLDSLYVCDASIFPLIMRANTNLPAVMVAEHLAETIGAP
jgi:choline dehydrogenase